MFRGRKPKFYRRHARIPHSIQIIVQICALSSKYVLDLRQFRSEERSLTWLYGWKTQVGHIFVDFLCDGALNRKHLVIHKYRRIFHGFGFEVAQSQSINFLTVILRNIFVLNSECDICDSLFHATEILYQMCRSLLKHGFNAIALYCAKPIKLRRENFL